MLLSVVIPVYHGEISITKLVETVQEQLNTSLFEIILVNDGSKDASEQICIGLSERYNNVSFLSLRKNFGEFNAVMCGLNHAKGEYAVIIDDDFQNPPSEIIKLLETAQKGNFDVVYSQYDEKNTTLSEILVVGLSIKLPQHSSKNRKIYIYPASNSLRKR